VGAFSGCPGGASNLLEDYTSLPVSLRPASSGHRHPCVKTFLDERAEVHHTDDRFSISQEWLCHGAAISLKENQEPRLIQEAMTSFIRTLLRGMLIEVLLDDGSVLFPETSLNYELTHLILDVNEAQRSIPLQDVESIATPNDLEKRNILMSIRPYLDDRCCTLIIRGYEFVTFRFDTTRLREYFAACLELLIARSDEQKGEVNARTVLEAVPDDDDVRAHSTDSQMPLIPEGREQRSGEGDVNRVVAGASPEPVPPFHTGDLHEVTDSCHEV